MRAAGAPRRGRPPTIDRETLVRTAARMSPETLTMSAVAREIGVSPSALYRWVTDREALLDLVSSTMTEWITPTRTPAPDQWQAWLREWAHNVRREFGRVPGFAVRVLTGPHRHPAHAHLEAAGVAAYLAGGAEPAQARRNWHAFSVAVVGWVAAEQGEHVGPDPESDFDALVTILLRGTATD